jgi:5-methyltetrahydrofolate--homocysteine methyltransferase
VEDVVLNRREDATERMIEFAATLEGRRQEEEATLEWRNGRSPSAWRMRWCTASPIHRRRHRRSAPAVAAKAAAHPRDRRPADGRHERRRRPVRPGQDVPAAGGEIGARDEAGRGPPDPLHRGRKAPAKRTGIVAKPKGKIVIATVKGDVHDIGKNIVTVVLQCNNFEVVNMGVMVPARDPGQAKEENADIIGLSGLITPSLEEMAYVAKEMQRDALPHDEDSAADRRRHHQRAHTAVKIAPTTKARWSTCRTPRVRVGGAALLTPKTPVHRRTQRRLRTHPRAARQQEGAPMLSLARRAPTRPGSTSPRSSPSSSAAACSRTSTWPSWPTTSTGARSSRPGTWPALPRHPDRRGRRRSGHQGVRRRPGHAEEDHRWPLADRQRRDLAAAGQRVNDDDIEIYTDDSRSQVAFTYYGLRQQAEKPVVDGVQRPNQCLADFIAPKDSGVQDYIGMFAVTAGLGIEKYEKRFEDAHDDYSAIMLKALADRLAEAFAEYLHERVRKDLWGYAADEQLSNDRADQGEIPRHPPGARLSGLPGAHGQGDAVRTMQCDEIGMQLTESYAMFPGAAVSGFYFAHRSRSTSWSARSARPGRGYGPARQVPCEDLERWLAPNL